jgi:hypothetical protein
MTVKAQMLVVLSLILSLSLSLPPVPSRAQLFTKAQLPRENTIAPSVASYDNHAMSVSASNALLESPNGLSWHIETIDNRGGFENTLVLGNNDYPHIAYQAQSPLNDHELNYAHWTGSQWVIEVVDSQGDTGWVIHSLALDKAGHPHIGYGGHQYSKLRYAHWTGGTWLIEDVGFDPSDWGYSGGSFALDANGYPHFAYCAQNPQLEIELRYAHWTGGEWSIEVVDSADCWYCTSMKLDANDHPHISYYDEGHSRLKYAHWTGSEWDVQVVDSNGSVGRPNSLALDTNGYPHISYYSWTNSELKYAQWTGSSWDIQDVDSIGGEIYNISTALALDAGDRPHIGYVDDISNTVKYAYWAGNEWVIETLDTGGDFGSIMLDNAGNSHISYIDATGHLKYAVGSPPRPPLAPLLLDKQAVPDDGLHNNDVLTYTLTLSGADLNVRLWDPLPFTVHYISGSLTSTSTPIAVYSPTAHAVLWQGTLPTDTAQTIRFQITPGITGAGSLLLAPPIVNTAWLTDTGNGRSVSDTVIVNGRHVYLPLIVCNR